MQQSVTHCLPCRALCTALYCQLARMLKNASPGITIQQIRSLVDMCYLNDMEDTGFVTYVQLLQVLF